MASKFGSSLIRFILLRIPQFWHQVLVLQDGVRWGRGWFETVSSPGGCGQTSEAVKSCWIRSPAPASPLADWMKQPPRDVGSSDAQIKLRGGVRGSSGTTCFSLCDQDDWGLPAPWQLSRTGGCSCFLWFSRHFLVRILTFLIFHLYLIPLTSHN